MLAQSFGKLSKRGAAYAVRDTLNDLAFATKAAWPQRMGRKFILRNKWTIGSIRLEKATIGPIENMQSRVGSALPYMRTQELGGTEHAKGKYGVTIPTTSSAGQAMKAPSRTKLVQKKNWQSAITIARTVSGRRQRQNAVAVQLAAKSGGVAFLRLAGGRKGMFRVSGGEGKRKRVRMIWDLSRKTVTVKPHPTLEPALREVEVKGPAMAEAAVRKQVELHVRKR